MYKYTRNLKKIYFEICCNCFRLIYGKTYQLEDSYHNIVIAKRKIVGIKTGEGWCSEYLCVSCFKEIHEK